MLTWKGETFVPHQSITWESKHVLHPISMWIHCECACLWSVRFPRPSRPVRRLLQSVRSWKGSRLARFSLFPVPRVSHELSNHECMSCNITSRRMPGIEEQLELARTGEELCHALQCFAMLCESEGFVLLPEAPCQMCQVGSVFDTRRWCDSRKLAVQQPAPSRWHLMIRASSS